MSNFWITFVITEAVTVASAFVQMSGLSPAKKAALENFIASGQQLVAVLHSGQ